MKLRNFRIGARAGIGFSAIAFLVIAMGVLALTQAKNMDESTERIRVDWLPAVVSIGDVGSTLGRVRALTLRTLILDDISERQHTADRIKELTDKVNVSLGDYHKTLYNPEDEKLYLDFETAYHKYLDHQGKILESALTQTINRDTLALANGPLAEHSDAMTSALHKLIEFNSHKADEYAKLSSHAYKAAFSSIIIALAVILILMITIATLLTRSIVSPITEAVGVANRIAEGDLTQRINVTGGDEPAYLLTALQKMQANLHETIDQISSSSNQLASASEELHAVTEDTNRGLNQQSAEIEQAATAVNEMTAAVEEVASNAVTTADASRDADQSTQEGRSKVTEALESINQLVGNVLNTSKEVQNLAESANEISQVLVVIRSIAEQTNLLALNAAIEAARAGEAGRGFAVVADEVRALAHRTQQSTAEIEQMIDGIQSGTSRAVEAMNESQERANHTLGVANAANEALEIISEAITSINQKNLVIASASEEQAQVAREVDRNLVNIRDLSMQTSAGANQTSASSQELSRLAVDLNAMISKFKV